MKKIVAVSTYCVWTSYGSILQSYALKRTLEKIGIESFVFIDMPEADPYEMTSLRLERGLKELILSGYNRFFRSKFLRQYNESKAFIKKYLDVVAYENYQEFQKNIPQADYYLSGSDQVFNPLKSSPIFFLDFAEDKSKCRTYACSMGQTRVPEEKEKIFSQLINNFDVISCREEEDIPILKKYNPDAVYLNHIDPTFLITPEEWEKLMIPYTRIKKPYVLVFAIYWDNNINKELKALHDQTGMDIVTISNGFSSVYTTKRLLDVSVGEFLWLIQNAEGVVSSSFHGAALSLILNKKLSVVINPDSPSRISCMMKQLAVKPLNVEMLINGKIEYEMINQKIMAEKARSIAYLKEIFDE